LLGRLPLVAVAGIVLVLASIAAHGALPSVRPIDLALLASAVPPLSGVALGAIAVVRAERWLSVVAKIVSSARPKVPGRLVGRQGAPETIALERVSFRYAADPRVADALHEVTLTCTGERIVALAGRNGSGKSTLLRLLLGLSKPRSGRVLVDGDDLFELDLDAWRSGIAFLSQSPYLPQRASIRDAVRVLAPDSSDARISTALERSGVLASLRASTPNPLDACVDALSAGQRQRVAIARLLCMDAPRMVLLDEPDAALDAGGVTLVADLVRELARTRIVFLSAHSPELLSAAERVIELDAGRIVRDERPAQARRLSLAP
jgi:ABC-type transport system involved in cytochrome bd biosynthesis fused ATPase/permease subunit